MNLLKIRDYTVQNLSQFSSTFLNQVFDDFSNSIIMIVLLLKKIIKKHNDQILIMNKGMDWITAQHVNMIMDSHTITANTSPVTQTDIATDTLYSTITLATTNVRESKIHRYVDDYGFQKANPSNIITYSQDRISWLDNEDLSILINGNDDVWSLTTDVSSIYIKLVIPDDDNYKASGFLLYPFAGTRIDELDWSDHTIGSTHTIYINSVYPYNYIREMDFGNVLIVKLTGVSNGDGTYTYMMKKIDIYKSTYLTTGTITYNIGPCSNGIADITINDDYILTQLKSSSDDTFLIKISDSDTSEEYYNSAIDTYPVTTPIPGNGTNDKILTLTLNKISGYTPVIKYIDVVEVE